MLESTIKEVQWKDVEKEVATVNPRLHKIICELDPGPEYRLYVGEYPYGAEILKNGQHFIPVAKHGMVPLTSEHVPKKIKEDLSYNIETNPVTLILENSLEIFLDKPTTENPLTFIVANEGSIFGLSRVLFEIAHQPAFLWNITSGVRSIFMLPKISQAKKYKRLRAELGIDINMPQSTQDHWDVFRKIANCGQFPAWKTRMIYFSKPWFNNLDDPKKINFKNYLLEKTANFFNGPGGFFIWETILNIILKKQDIRPTLYINNMVKHILQIGTGIIPGTSPDTSNKKAPIEIIQKVFTDIYNIKDYIPTIMTPNYFYPHHDQRKPIYYSMHNPNLLDTPKKKDNSSNISDLYEVKSLLDKYIYYMKTNEFNIEHTQFHKFFNNSQVSAIHTHPERYTTIEPVDNIFSSDSRFKKTLYPTKNKEIARFGAFFKGCFKIS